MEFGALIKFYRTQRGMTQSELAKGICSVPHLSKIENNSKEANEETISLSTKRLQLAWKNWKKKKIKLNYYYESLRGKLIFI